MAGRLEDKVALITGGASGIGEAQARLFSREGAGVMIADLQAEKGEAVASEIGAVGGNAAFAHLDVRDWEQWQAVVAQTEKRFGRLDILCNNAGTNRRVGFMELAVDEYKNIVDVNLHGTYLGCRAVKDAMNRVGGGAILNIGSMSSLMHTSSTGYTVSKTGILALTKNVAWHFAPDRTRCNAICPGNVDTPFIRDDQEHSHNDWSTSIDNPENYERRRMGIPLGRLQTGEDIAKAALFLCSDDADQITGAVLTVDGGTALC
jgi:NAD(P)-dependent dehydrogenase (short-subunit alcohol dehydrogenase family)